MVRNILSYFIIVTIVISFISCEKLVEGSTLITGNQQYRSGEYQDAIIHYLKGLESDVNKDYFYYNLGNVYSSLGEYPSAFSIWNLANGGTNSQLKFNLLYNRGFLEYQLGNYGESYKLFRQSLIIIPSSIKSKINLELSLNKMSAATYSQPPDNKKDEPFNKGASDETQRILEYVKQKEAMSWGVNQQEKELENDW